MINITQSFQNIITAFAAVVGGFAAVAFLTGGLMMLFSVDNPALETRAGLIFRAAITGSVIAIGAASFALLLTNNIK